MSIKVKSKKLEKEYKNKNRRRRVGKTSIESRVKNKWIAHFPPWGPHPNKTKKKELHSLSKQKATRPNNRK